VTILSLLIFKDNLLITILQTNYCFECTYLSHKMHTLEYLAVSVDLKKKTIEIINHRRQNHKQKVHHFHIFLKFLRM